MSHLFVDRGNENKENPTVEQKQVKSVHTTAKET
jgi:hypothetical protein